MYREKYEVQRDELSVDGNQDGYLHHHREPPAELARMIKEARLDFPALPDEEFDPYYGDYSGAAVIFGATGGIMEGCGSWYGGRRLKRQGYSEN